MTVKAYIRTIGCKANFADTEKLAECLEKRGVELVPRGKDANLVIVNSCVVTGRAESDSRKALSRGKRENPNAMTLLTGCGAAGKENARLRDHADEQEEMDPDRIASYISRAFGISEGRVEPIQEKVPGIGRARKFLKIQNGCEYSCSYCIVPEVRGKNVSRPEAEIVEELIRLEEQGFMEVVLTGIHIGHYGMDLREELNLEKLVSELLAKTRKVRLRLSSVEFDEVEDNLLNLVAEGGRACNHLHLPLQSGDDDVLVRMKRWYTSGSFNDFVEKAKAKSADLCIGTDIITGFPGESALEFENTYRFLEKSGIDYAHVFTYSPRDGTEAADMPGQVPGSIKKERTSRLLSLSKIKWARYVNSFIGRELDMISEKEESSIKGFSGTSSNYIKVRVLNSSCDPGKLVRVRIIERDGDKAVATCN